MFSRNLNTGGHNETETKFVSAQSGGLPRQTAPVSRAAASHPGGRVEEVDMERDFTEADRTILTDEAVSFLKALRGKLRGAPPATSRSAARAPAGDRWWALPEFLAGNGLDPGFRLGGRAHPRRSSGPPRGDHRAGGSQDDHQRPELGRQRVHGRFRGFQFAHVAQQPGRAEQPARRGQRRHRLCQPGRQALRAGREDRRADGAAARLASGRETLSRGGRPSPRRCSISACTSSTTPRP
jgi:hypothetical protein